MLRRWPLLYVGILVALAAAPRAAAAWTASGRVETYAISGTTGIELYRSIGERGPKIGLARAIAYTTFDLRWSRDYRPAAGGACRLAAARPKLVIVTKLPKPAEKLAADVQARWETFIAGIAAHERYHAETIVDMVEKIEAYSVGLTVADDPKCRRIREVLTQRLSELSQEQRAKGRDFDKAEMGAGGNVHRLVMGLIGDQAPSGDVRR